MRNSIGGSFLDFKEIWPVIGQFPFGEPTRDIRHMFYGNGIYFKVPPNTGFETVMSEDGVGFSLENDYVKCVFTGHASTVKMTADTNYRKVGMAFRCTISFKLLSKFRSHFSEYFVWTIRIFRSLGDYFDDTIRPRSGYSGSKGRTSDPVLWVGDKRDKKLYQCESDSEQLMNIPRDSRAFFNSIEAARTEGFSGASGGNSDEE